MMQLKTIPLSGLVNWSVQYLLESTFSYNPDYELVPIGKFLTRNKTSIDIEDDTIYKRVTIRANNLGVYLRDTEKGENIGTKKQFVIKKGQFLVSKIDARNGAFGVIPDEVDGAIITGNFWMFDVDTSIINPYFLSLIVTTPEFIRFCENASNGTTNRHYLQEDLFLAQPIPLPTLQEQNRIVSTYDQKNQLAKQQEQEANNLKQEIEEYLMEKLDLKKLDAKENVKGLQLISFKNIDRWDILAKDMRILNGLNTSKFPLKKMGDVFSFAKRSWNKKKYNKETFRYIELGAIDTIEGITEIKEILTNKAPSRATQQVVEGDLLIGTTRPYLKRFVIIDHRYDGDICSSGFNVLEPNQNTELAFLKEFLMSYYGLEQLKNRMTGATYPAITTTELKEILVPFPPRFVQIEIASEINKMRRKIKNLQNEAKQNREQALLNFEQEIFNS